MEYLKNYKKLNCDENFHRHWWGSKLSLEPPNYAKLCKSLLWALGVKKCLKILCNGRGAKDSEIADIHLKNSKNMGKNETILILCL